MCRGRHRSARSLIVAQARLVWELIDEQTTGEHLQEFIETGQLGAAPVAIPYNPAVMEEIAKNWTWNK
jgi:hypothetical protein